MYIVVVVVVIITIIIITSPVLVWQPHNSRLKFDKPDGTVRPLRRSKRLQENLKDKDSYISA